MQDGVVQSGSQLLLIHTFQVLQRSVGDEALMATQLVPLPEEADQLRTLLRWPLLERVATPLLAALAACALKGRCNMLQLWEQLCSEPAGEVAAGSALVPATAGEALLLMAVTALGDDSLQELPGGVQPLALLSALVRHLLAVAASPDLDLAQVGTRRTCGSVGRSVPVAAEISCA